MKFGSDKKLGDQSHDGSVEQVGVAPAELDHDEFQRLDDDELESIGDLGNDFDDPEGWMAKRPNYWDELAVATQPTRLALLSHRVKEALDLLLKEIMPSKKCAWTAERMPDCEWRRLADMAFGYAPAHTDHCKLNPTSEPTASQSRSLHCPCHSSAGSSVDGTDKGSGASIGDSLGNPS